MILQPRSADKITAVPNQIFMALLVKKDKCDAVSVRLLWYDYLYRASLVS